MNKIFKKENYYHHIGIAFTVCFVLLVGLGVRSYFLVRDAFQDGTVLSATKDLQVQAVVAACDLTFTVYPEERAATVYAEDVFIEIYDSTDTIFVGSHAATTDSSGQVTFDACNTATPFYLLPGTYNIYVKGNSHLRRDFGPVVGFTTAASAVDLTLTGFELLAGDVNADDEEINSLDITHLVRTFGLTNIDAGYNIRYDLNRDGVIDMDDINILLANLYKTGDVI